MKRIINFTINRDKNGVMKSKAKELGFIPSVVISYGILRLLDMMDGKKLSNVDRKFVIMAIDEFEHRTNESNTRSVCVSFSLIYNLSEIAERLLEHGFHQATIARAFYNALLRCNECSIPRLSAYNGFVLSHIKSYRVLNLKNKPLKINISISELVLQELEEIANQNKTSPFRIVSRVVDTLIAIEYEHDTYIENSGVIRENIFLYNKKVTGITGDRFLEFKIRKLDKSVRILVLLEKYGIPGLAELFQRIIRFILLSYSHHISLNQITVNDNQDYNETRMIRNEFRKEVLYASTH